MNFLKRISRKNRFRLGSSDASYDQIDPLRRLWMLRYITLCGRNSDFIESYGYDDEKLALALGFSECEEDSDFNPAHARRELKKLTKAAEAKSRDARLPGVLARNLQKLSEHIPLTHCEQWILAFAVLAQEGSELQSVVNGPLQVTRSTLSSLVAQLLGFPKPEVDSALKKDGSLYGSGLLKNDSYEIKGDVTEFLTPLSEEFASGMAHEDTEIANLFQSAFRVAPAPSLVVEDFAHLGNELELLLVHAKKSLEQKRIGVNYLLHGVPGTGKTELSRIVADVLNLPLHEIVVEDEDGDSISVSQRSCAFKSGQTFLRFSESIIAFDEADEVLEAGSSSIGDIFGVRLSRNSGVSKAWINRTLEANFVPTIWIANDTRHVEPAVLRRFDRIIEVPIPPQQQRERLIRKLVPNVEPSFYRALSASSHLTPGVVQKGVDFASTVEKTSGSRSWCKAAVDAINGTLRGQCLPSIKLNDPTLLPSFYNVDYINADSDLRSIANSLQHAGSSRVCLYGPPGTGKTAFARWVAKDFNCSLLRVNGSDLLGPYVGQTEQNIRNAFDRAERDGSILLFDEIDSFLFSRNLATRSWEVTQVNEFLAQLESFSGQLFATTNYEKILDHASLRRFDLKIGFEYLQPKQAESLVRKCCEELGLEAPATGDYFKLHTVQNIALGDFATVMRQSKFKGISTAIELIELLMTECSMKRDSKQSIGFK